MRLTISPQVRYILTRMNVNVYENYCMYRCHLKMYTHMSVYKLCMCVFFNTPVATFAGPLSYLPQLRMLDVK